MTVAEGIISQDLPCTTCGYNLRTLAHAAVCPECGTTVKKSLESSLVRWGPRVVRRLGRATGFAAGLNVAAALVIVGGVAAAFIVEVVMRSMRAQFILPAIFGLCFLIALLHIITTWIIGRASPANRTLMLAVMLRIASLGVALMTLVPFVMFGIQLVLRGMDYLEWMAPKTRYFVAAWTLLMPSLAIFSCLMGEQMARLCKGAGMQSSVPWYRGFAWTFAAGMCLINLGFVGAVLANFEVISFRSQASQIILGIGLLGGMGVAGIGFMCATVLLFITASRFRRAARQMES